MGLIRFNPTCTKACKNKTTELEWLLEAVNRQLYVSYRSYVDLKIITFVKAVVINELPWPHKLNESGMNIFVLHDKKQRYSSVLQNKRLYKRQLIKTHPITNVERITASKAARGSR